MDRRYRRAMRILFLLLAIVFPVVNAVAADPAMEIRAVMDRQVAAWNRGDIDGYMEGYVRSDKLEFVSGGKITRGSQTRPDRYHPKYDRRAKMAKPAFS